MMQPGFYNMDCMDALPTFPDKFFDLAIVDPPYGIGESGKTNHTRSKLATAKDYEPYWGATESRQARIISKSYFGCQRIK